MAGKNDLRIEDAKIMFRIGWSVYSFIKKINET